MQEAWKGIVHGVTEKANRLLEEKQIDQDAGQIDYVAIFPKNQDGYNSLMVSLGQAGEPVRVVPTGTVFKLREPLETPHGIVGMVRIRIFDPSKSQLGYVDYALENYGEFKEKYLTSGVVNITHSADGVEMLTLENEEVIIYFPETPLGKSLEN